LKARESVELATQGQVAWFDHHRLVEPPGGIRRAEAEAKAITHNSAIGLLCRDRLKPFSLHDYRGRFKLKFSIALFVLNAAFDRVVNELHAITKRDSTIHRDA
jgi:hypothetical protein